MVRKIAQPERAFLTGLQLLVISVIECSPPEQNEIAFPWCGKSTFLSLLGDESTQVSLACQLEGFLTGNQMIVELRISIVVGVLPNMLPLLEIVCRLPVSNREIVVMNDRIISEEQFRWRIPMDSNFAGIHCMNNLIQIEAPTMDISSSDHNLPNSVKNQLDIPFQEPN